MPRPMVEIEVFDVLHETDDALLCVFEGQEEVWIPKSQIGDDSDVPGNGDIGMLEIPEWLAIEKGLV